MLCRQCGYILTGLQSPRCPECGRAFDPADRRTFHATAGQFARRRWLRRALRVLAVLLVALASYVALYLSMLERQTQPRKPIAFASFFVYPSGFSNPQIKLPTYPQGGKIAEFLFSPAAFVDEKLFPSRWRTWEPNELAHIYEFLLARPATLDKGTPSALQREQLESYVSATRMLTPTSEQYRQAIERSKLKFEDYKAAIDAQ